MTERLYMRYWGKAKPGSEGAQYHLLAYHCLDVAAVGKVLWEKHHSMRLRLLSMLKMPEEAAKDLLLFFLTLHDLGKFSEAFQSLQPKVAIELRGKELKCFYKKDFRHDRLGLWLWEDKLINIALSEDWFGIHDEDGGELLEALNYWILAFTGHHGLPRQIPDNWERLEEHFTQDDHVAALDWCRRMCELFGPFSLTGIDLSKFIKASKQASWLLAGVATLADWIGSNASPGRFVYHDAKDTVVDLQAYWKRALLIAEQAVEDFGVLPNPVGALTEFRDLFPNIAEPSPLQKLAQTVPVEKEPTLYLIEDVTGAGKTEAALLLAHRLMTAGMADGLYIGLPSMATSNAMFERLAKSYRRLFAEDSKPSIALAHGARHLSEPFRKIIEADFNQAAFPGQSKDFENADEGSATAHCNAWIADSRKKTFFADAGVGTLDQALLGILPAKHQSMRLLGLSQRVLIADEVHAYDEYTSKLLEVLLTFQAALGGSAVLLSATLPYKLRERLVKAFRKGLGVKSAVDILKKRNYPLLTRATANDEVNEYQVDTRADVARRVEVRALREPEDAIKVLLEAVQASQCACWIRNTVADAIDTFQTLLAIPELKDRVELFHARFALGDRLDIERRVLDRFGKDGNVEGRKGRILIASQVIEMSVDCDFDVMVSDLAPIDVLIQRAGRAHRHRRYADGRLISDGTPDQRGSVVLHLLMPEAVDDPKADWFTRLFPRQGKVYSDHALLWRTARLFNFKEDNGWVSDHPRDLIEAVYGSEDKVPVGLQRNADQAEGENLCHRNVATQRTLRFEAGYRFDDQSWKDEALVKTRLGDETVTVWLACWDGQRLIPWYQGEQAWDYSALSVRENLIQKEVLPTSPVLSKALDDLRSHLPAKGKFGQVLVLRKGGAGEWIGEAISKGDKRKCLRYCAEIGLRETESE